MNSGLLTTISDHLDALQAGVGVPAGLSDINAGDVAQGLLGIGSALEGLASIVGRGNPLLAAGLGLADVAISIENIATDATTNGTVQRSDLTSLAAGLAGTIGGATLAITGAAVTTAALPVVLGAALLVTAVALTIQAQTQGDDDVINTPEFKEMYDAAKKFLDEAGAAGKAITDALLDPAFWDDFAEHGAALFEPLLDPLNDAAQWVEQNLPTPQEIKDKVKTWWDDAQHWLQRRDPLTLDLDGDGLETTGVAATNPILFDHDGDGIKNGTGWVNADDGFLVRDVNGNGTIDSGRELFGDSTIKSNGQLATDGFDALADLDSLANGGNADGRISSADAQFANLRVWRDLNQDGNSQTGELFTLASLNIASINVTRTANSQTLPNGNQIADLGTFTKTDGTTGTTGAVTGNMADVNLAGDTFHRTFPNVLDTTSVATLPDMQGSGAVRDLREAATQSTTLQSLLTQFAAATTRAGQMALIDQLLDAWADTGGMAESMTQRVAGMAGFTRADGTVIPYTLSSNLSAEWTQKLHIIESFNGSYFYGLPGTTQTAGAITGLTIATPTVSSTAVQITANLMQNQLDLLQQSYDAIKGSVYDALVLQTRFKPLLDQINLVIDASGISLDFSQLTTTFNQAITANAETGLLDLIDFNFASNGMLKDTSWQGWQQMANQLEITQTTAVNDALMLHGTMVIGLLGFLANGTASNDLIIGEALEMTF